MIHVKYCEHCLTNQGERQVWQCYRFFPQSKPTVSKHDTDKNRLKFNQIFFFNQCWFLVRVTHLKDKISPIQDKNSHYFLFNNEQILIFSVCGPSICLKLIIQRPSLMLCENAIRIIVLVKFTKSGPLNERSFRHSDSTVKFTLSLVLKAKIIMMQIKNNE